MANCSSCGNELGGRFCGICGADNGAAPTPTTPPTRPFPGATPPPSYTAQTTYAAQVPVEQVPVEEGFPEIGGTFRVAWKTASQHVGDWIVTIVVAGFIIGVFVGLYVLYNFIITDSEKFGGYSFETKHHIPLIELLLGIIALFAGSFIRYGFARTALATARGHRAIFNDAWSPSRFLPFVVFDLVIGWMFVAGFGLPFLGSLIVISVSLYAPFLIIERKGSGVSAIWNSITMTTTKGRFWRQVLFTIIGLTVLGTFFGAFWTTAQIVGQAGYDDWSSVWQNLTLVVFVGGELVVFAIAVIVAMTAAATAYVTLEREG